MDFELTDDQRAILDAVEALFAQHAGAARAIELDAKAGWTTRLDAALDEAGFPEVALGRPETGTLEAALVVEAVARRAGTVAGRRAALGRARADRARAAGAGRARRRARTGPVRFARACAHAAGRRRRRGAPGLARAGRRRAGALELHAAGGTRARSARGRASRSAPAPASRCAAGGASRSRPRCAGTMQAALDVTVEYVKRRRQFGRAIGSFQAVQHRLAQCAVRVEATRWLAFEAAAQGAPAGGGRDRRRLRRRRRQPALRRDAPALGRDRLHSRARPARLEHAAAGAAARARRRAGAPRARHARSAGPAALEPRPRARRHPAGDRRRGGAVLRRALSRGGRARDARARSPRELWRELAELGVLALATPEGDGGARELVAALEALGAAVFPGPLAATFLRDAVLAERERARVAQRRGDRRAGDAAAPAVRAGGRLFVALDGESALARAARRGRAGRRRSAASPGVASSSRAAQPLGAARARWRCTTSRSRPTPPRAGHALGRGAAEHARTRQQFGRAIGEFQAVAHPLADARDPARRRRDAGAHRRARAGTRARTTCARAPPPRASRRRRARSAAAHTAHQVFGALGITLEGPVFHVSRRIRQLASQPPPLDAARTRRRAARAQARKVRAASRRRAKCQRELT